MSETKLERKVPLLDLRSQYDRIAGEIGIAIQSVLDSQKYILGPEVIALEKELAQYCQSQYGVGCASGSDALLLALMAYDIGVGDEVITTPYTFFATVGAIVRLGAKPVLVDIDPESFNIDEKQIESAITPRTKAIIPIHLFGQCAEMEVINGLADQHGFQVVEDAAQAIGAEYKGRRAGSLGHLACFSFYPSKNLGGVGDGGLLTTADENLASKLKALRAHGAKIKYFHDWVGINSRLDSIQAAILRVKLKYVEEWTESRIANANRYRELFSQTMLIEQGLVVLPAELTERRHIYNQFVIRVEKRDALRAHLQNSGVGTEIYYPQPLHLQSCFQFLDYRSGDFPESEKASSESVAIPIYPELGGPDQEYVVSCIADFYKS
jgi:dTDP-4-amino-4,6-dideoxygalactose transaminase